MIFVEKNEILNYLQYFKKLFTFIFFLNAYCSNFDNVIQYFKWMTEQDKYYFETKLTRRGSPVSPSDLLQTFL